MPNQSEVDIVVVGAGLSGIAAGVKLLENGFHDFVILEKADDLGGSWRDNVYPGLTVDIPCLTYSFSFHQKPDWSRIYAPRAEILDYCRDVTDHFGVRSHLRFAATVVESRFDADTHLWHTRLSDGHSYVSRYVIGATGYLSVPRWPDFDGIDRFEGKALHTSNWDNDYDLTGKRVAFVGTGATGIQLIPEIADRGVEALHVFQRTPVWVLPKLDAAIPPAVQSTFRRLPGMMRLTRFLLASVLDLVLIRVFVNYRQVRPLAQQIERLCLWHLRKQVDNPGLIEKFTPEYNWACKRPVFSNTFYPAFSRSNVELVTEPIERVTPNGIVTGDNIERPIDVLVCGTGFQPYGKESTPTFTVIGKDGTALDDFWDENHYQALRGVATTNYPNYFMVGGPYSIAHHSYVQTIETSVRYIIRVLREARTRRASYVEVRPESQAAEYRDILKKRKKELFFVGNCAGANTYYIDRFGDTPSFRPSYHPKVWLDSKLGLFVKHFIIK